MRNLHDIAVTQKKKHILLGFEELARSHWESHILAWKCFYEQDYSTRFYLGAMEGYRTLNDVFVIEVMESLLDAGIAPTPAQVGANPAMVRGAFHLYRASVEELKAFGRHLGFRIEAAMARLHARG